MREILFRGKRISGDEFRYGDLRHGPVGRTFIIEDGVNQFEVNPVTVGQYTGFTDRNGQRIFEGDIVITQYGRKCIIDWFFSPAYCGWNLKSLDDAGKPPCESTMWFKEILTVIGNIHDNPELLNLPLQRKGEQK